MDASYDNIKRTSVKWDNRYSETAGSTPYAYPIYRDINGVKRKQYMQESISSTLDSLKGILRNITASGGTTKDINIAWNTFAHSLIYSSNGFTKLDDNFNIAINQTAGGTHQDKGLNDATNFNWPDTNQKYAILITDGAPNDSSVTDIFQDVRNAATALKNKGVTLITVGLSTTNVSEGSALLKEIASTYTGSSNKLFFEANNK